MSIDSILTDAKGQLEEHVVREVQAASLAPWPAYVSVEKCLPIEHTICLCYVMDWHTAFYNKQGRFLINGEDATERVKFWMPCPPAPPRN
jgi:hypothetical protein